MNLWVRFPVAFMNTWGFMQVFDFSQAFEPCDFVPSYELSPAKPPKSTNADTSADRSWVKVGAAAQIPPRREQGKTSPGL